MNRDRRRAGERARATVALAVLGPSLVVNLALAGCGVDGHGVRAVDRARLDREALESLAGTGGTRRVHVTARQGSYAFEEAAVRAAAGRVSITLENPTGVWHNVMVLDESRPGPAEWPYLGHQPVLPATGANRFASDTAVVELPAGRYRLICNVLGHADNGMTIPLDVVDEPRATERPLPDTARQAVATLPANQVTLTRKNAEAKWDRTEVTIGAGRIGFALVNQSTMPTNLIVLRPDGGVITPDAPVIARGRAGFVIDLPRGEYSLTNLAAATTMTIPLHVQ